jgi:hypothetical protein
MCNHTAVAKTFVMAACTLTIALLTIGTSVNSSWAGSDQPSGLNFTPISTKVVLYSATISSRLGSTALMAALMIRPPTQRSRTPYLHREVLGECRTSDDCPSGQFCNSLLECTDDSTSVEGPLNSNPGSACNDTRDCAPCDFCNSRGVCVPTSPTPASCE